MNENVWNLSPCSINKVILKQRRVSLTEPKLKTYQLLVVPAAIRRLHVHPMYLEYWMYLWQTVQSGPKSEKGQVTKYDKLSSQIHRHCMLQFQLRRKFFIKQSEDKKNSYLNSVACQVKFRFVRRGPCRPWPHKENFEMIKISREIEYRLFSIAQKAVSEIYDCVIFRHKICVFLSKENGSFRLISLFSIKNNYKKMLSTKKLCLQLIIFFNIIGQAQPSHYNILTSFTCIV